MTPITVKGTLLVKTGAAHAKLSGQNWKGIVVAQGAAIRFRDVALDPGLTVRIEGGRIPEEVAMRQRGDGSGSTSGGAESTRVQVAWWPCWAATTSG